MFVEVNLKVACTHVCGNQMPCLNVQLFMPKSTGIRPGKEEKQYSSGQTGLANPSWLFNVETPRLSDVVFSAARVIGTHTLYMSWELCTEEQADVYLYEWWMLT